MSARFWTLAAVVTAGLAVAACQTQQPNSAGSVAPAGGATGTGGTGSTGSGSSVPTLVNVNLENVLNNLAVSLNVERANIPVNAQIPVDVAANVCGVSVNVLSAAIASGHGSCTATTTSPTLIQYVQQQLSASGPSATTPQ